MGDTGTVPWGRGRGEECLGEKGGCLLGQLTPTQATGGPLPYLASNCRLLLQEGPGQHALGWKGCSGEKGCSESHFQLEEVVGVFRGGR